MIARHSVVVGFFGCEKGHFRALLKCVVEDIFDVHIYNLKTKMLYGTLKCAVQLTHASTILVVITY